MQSRSGARPVQSNFSLSTWCLKPGLGSHRIGAVWPGLQTCLSLHKKNGSLGKSKTDTVLETHMQTKLVA